MTPDGEFIARGEFTFNYTDYGIEAPRLLFAVVGGFGKDQRFFASAAFAQNDKKGFEVIEQRAKPPTTLFALPAGHDVTIAFHIRARRPGTMPASPTP